MAAVNNNPSSRSYVFMAIAILGWGLSSNFIEFGLKSINPFPFLFYRFFTTVVIITLPVLYLRGRLVRELIKNKWVWIIGFSESSGLILQYLGQREGVNAGPAALLSLLFLLIVPFLSPFILKEKLRSYHLLSVFIALSGVLLISIDGNIDNLRGTSIKGILLLLGAAISYAFYIVSTSRLTQIEKTDVDTLALFYIIMVIITLTSFIAFLVFDKPVSPNSDALTWIILLAIFSTIIAFFGYFEALKQISANVASVLLPLQVLVPYAIDVIILKRTYSLWIFTGSVLIIIAMLVVVIYPYRSSSVNQNLDLYGENTGLRAK